MFIDTHKFTNFFLKKFIEMSSSLNSRMKKLLVSTPCKSEVSNTCKSNVIRNMRHNCECGEGYKCVYISIYIEEPIIITIV